MGAAIVQDGQVFSKLGWQSVSSSSVSDDAGKDCHAAAEQPADQTLVRAAQSGDRAAFGILYQRYSRMVHGILLARVPHTAVDDLVQDVFLHILPRLASLRDSSRFGAWLGATTKNLATDFFRRSRPTDTLDVDNPAHELETPTQDLAAEERLALLNAIRALPDAYRVPLILRFVEGMTGPEIAARLGMKHGSVRVNLHRGMQMLRETWHEAPAGGREKTS
jgi:RNA polymerase sigma-70 factor (ECF subfamily)